MATVSATSYMPSLMVSYSSIKKYVNLSLKKKKDRVDFEKFYKAIRKCEYMEHFKKSYRDD